MQLENAIIECDPPKSDNKVELSIIIPCRAENFSVLMMTLQSIQEECIAATQHLGDGTWECIVVFNSKEGESTEAEDCFKKCNLRKYGNFRYIAINKQSSAIARSIGIFKAIGRYVYIGDSHIIVGRDCFKYLMETHAKLTACRVPVGILHSALGWMSGVHHKDLCDCYSPKITAKFWGDYSKSGIKEPHPICMKGTAFLMLRDYTMDIGLWNINFKSYGGSEAYINLKTWRFGYEVWVEPKSYIWHLACKRGYSWYNDEFIFNNMLAAYTIGGDKWLAIVFNNYMYDFEKKHSNLVLAQYTEGLKIMYNTVKEVGKEDKDFINSRSKHTLDELMAIHGWK